MTRRTFALSSIAVCTAPVWAQSPALVFAAASLKGVLDEVSQAVTPLRVSYGGSGALARQIIAGAPADLFLSANPVWMDAVENALPIPARRDLLGNDLVLVGASGAPSVALDGWQPGGGLAMGFTRSVPAGQYGKAAFEALGIWDAVRPHVVEVESVSAALALVARGAVPFGVVYATDALAEPRVDVLARFSPSWHSEIRYPLALLHEPSRPVFDALTGSAAKSIFRDAGFTLL
ncbi:MAG: molybdate ABC transporter substrate-binding protein [Pseudomonadota bacterium]